MNYSLKPYLRALRRRAALHGVAITDDNLGRFIADETVLGPYGEPTPGELAAIRKALGLA